MLSGSAISTATCSTRGSRGRNSAALRRKGPFWCGLIGWLAGVAPERRPMRPRRWPKRSRPFSAAGSAPAARRSKGASNGHDDAKRGLGAKATGSEGTTRVAAMCLGPEAGGGFEIREFPRGRPAAGEIEVAVEAASVNPIDVRRAEGYGRRLLSLMGASRFPMTLGNDFAGTIVAVGERVTAFAVLRGEPIRLGFRARLEL